MEGLLNQTDKACAAVRGRCCWGWFGAYRGPRNNTITIIHLVGGERPLKDSSVEAARRSQVRRKEHTTRAYGALRTLVLPLEFRCTESTDIRWACSLIRESGVIL